MTMMMIVTTLQANHCTRSIHIGQSGIATGDSPVGVQIPQRINHSKVNYSYTERLDPFSHSRITFLP